MEFDHGSGMENHSDQSFTADSSLGNNLQGDSHKNGAHGSSIHTERVEEALDSLAGGQSSDEDRNQQSGSSNQQNVADSLNSDSRNQNESSGSSDSNEFNHISPDQLSDSKTLDPAKVQEEQNIAARLGNNGDVLDGGSGNNTVIGAGGNDVILGNTEGAFNTVTTGTGEDIVVLGKEATNRIFDFDPQEDQFGLDGFSANDIIFGQGTNPAKEGLDQPLDSSNNAVVIDRDTNHILASLTFTNAGDLSERNFVTVSSEDLSALTA